MDETTYIMLTPAERERRAKLTKKEKALVDAFVAAARALPKSITISLDDHEGELSVRKRITPGAAKQVALLRKKSLCF